MIAGGEIDWSGGRATGCWPVYKYSLDLNGDGDKEAKLAQTYCKNDPNAAFGNPQNNFLLWLTRRENGEIYIPVCSHLTPSIHRFSLNYFDSRTPSRELETAPVEKVLCRGNPCQIPQYRVGDEIKLPTGETARFYGPAYDIDVTNGVLIDSLVYYVSGDQYRPVNPPISLSKVELVKTRSDLEKQSDRVIRELGKKYPKEMKDWKYFSALVDELDHLREPYQTQARNAERVLGNGLVDLVEKTVSDAFGQELLVRKIRETLPLSSEVVQLAAR